MLRHGWWLERCRLTLVEVGGAAGEARLDPKRVAVILHAVGIVRGERVVLVGPLKVPTREGRGRP